MLRSLVLIVAVIALSVAAYCGDGEERRPIPAVTGCPADTAGCTPVMPGEQTPEAVVPEALDILMAEPRIGELLAGKVAGTDYWLNFGGPPPDAPNARGERPVTIEIVFKEPFDLTGNIPVFSEPCSGVGGEDGDIPDDHPCRTTPRTYKTVTVEWHIESRLLHAYIDMEREVVVDLFNPGISGDSVNDMIEYLDRYYDGSY